MYMVFSWQVLKLASAEVAVDEFFLLINSKEKLSTADSECITRMSLICCVWNMEMFGCPKAGSCSQVHAVEKSAGLSSFCFCNTKQMELFHSLRIRNSGLSDYYSKVHKILLHFIPGIFCISDFSQTSANFSFGLDKFSSSFHFLSVPAAAYCSVNDPPANGGVINRTRLRPGSKLFYYCNRGYRLVGSSNATCRLHPNGLFQWDTAPPLCQGEHQYICVCLYAYKYIHTYTLGSVLEKMHQFNPHGSSEVAVSRLSLLSGALSKELAHSEKPARLWGKKTNTTDTTSASLGPVSVGGLKLYQQRIVCN